MERRSPPDKSYLLMCERPSQPRRYRRAAPRGQQNVYSLRGGSLASRGARSPERSQPRERKSIQGCNARRWCMPVVACDNSPRRTSIGPLAESPLIAYAPEPTFSRTMAAAIVRT